MKANPSLSDVSARREQLEAEIEERKLELSELAFAERVLRRLGEYTPAVRVAPSIPGVTLNSIPRHTPPRPPSPPPVPRSETFAVDSAKESIESLILIILGASDRIWWTANELQSELTALKSADVPMSTISPTLTNMKNSGKITRDGLRVADPNRVPLTDRLELLVKPSQNENGEAFASPETGEPASSPNDRSA